MISFTSSKYLLSVLPILSSEYSQLFLVKFSIYECMCSLTRLEGADLIILHSKQEISAWVYVLRTVVLLFWQAQCFTLKVTI